MPNPRSGSHRRLANFALHPTSAKLPKESQPTFIPPQLAQQAETPPANSGWLHELKLDGYRIQARKDEPALSSSPAPASTGPTACPAIAAEIARLPAEQLHPRRRSRRPRPRRHHQLRRPPSRLPRRTRKHHLTYFAFDLLHLNGHNTRNLPLRERKALLAQLLAPADPHTLHLSDHLESNGPTIFHKACEMRAEGIVSKLASAKYTSGRSSAWLKCKCLHEQELVIGGFTLPSAGHTGMRGVGALLLGYYEGESKLIYAGRVGTGFTQKTHKLLRDKLDPLAQPKPPFDLSAKPLAPAEARSRALGQTHPRRPGPLRHLDRRHPRPPGRLPRPPRRQARPRSHPRNLRPNAPPLGCPTSDSIIV